VLVDSRRGINNYDATMMDTLNKTFIPYQVSLTYIYMPIPTSVLVWLVFALSANCTYHCVKYLSHSIFNQYFWAVLQIVFTKADLVTPVELQANLAQAFDVINDLGTACLPFIPAVTTVSKSGVEHFKLAMGEVYGQKWNVGEM